MTKEEAKEERRAVNPLVGSNEDLEELCEVQTTTSSKSDSSRSTNEGKTPLRGILGCF